MEQLKKLLMVLAMAAVSAQPAHAEVLSYDEAQACIEIAENMDELERDVERYESILEDIDRDYQAIEDRLGYLENDLDRAERKYNQCMADDYTTSCEYEAESYNDLANEWNDRLELLEKEGDHYNKQLATYDKYLEKLNTHIYAYNANCTDVSLTKEIYTATCGTTYGANSFCQAFDW